MTGFRSVGMPVARPDGPAKVRGEARYPQDLPHNGLLHAASVRAGVPHAILRRIDTTSALGVPGVVRVLTANDVPGTNRFGLVEPDQPVLVEDRVRTAADVVALVVGRDERSAREGARRLHVEFEALPAVTDPSRACDDDAPLLHPERAGGGGHPNLLAERVIELGNAPQALASAPVVIEGEYSTGWVEHAFLGVEAGIAAPDDHGLTLWTATQWPAEDLRQAAAAIGEPLERLRLVQAEIGGAFGGREDISLQILLLLAAQQMSTGVRIVWDRAESILGHGKRHPYRMRYRLGADLEGNLLALHATILSDAGAYASTSAEVLATSVAQAAGPYRIDDVLIEGRTVFTNNPVTCAFRGFGVNQVNFAMEQQMNKLAHRLSIDPGELRRRNIARPGERLGTGQRILDDHGLVETLERVLERSSQAPLPSPAGTRRFGRGIACGMKNVGYSFGFDDHATARVTLTAEGATVQIAAADVGQGIETVLTQIAAEALDMPPSRIHIEWRDTSVSPDAGSSSASHQTFVSGNAVRRACERARQLAEDAKMVHSPPGSGGAITMTEEYHAPRTQPEPGSDHPSYAFSWSSCAADVAVDIETGVVEVLRIVEAVDAGKVMNPLLLAGQIEGGVVMGQGYALLERFDVRDGVPLTKGLGDCAVPTAVDAPPIIESIMVEAPDAEGPYGARGVGEVTMLPVVPAITAAIHAATSTWVDDIPATPERVLRAMGVLLPSGKGADAPSLT